MFGRLKDIIQKLYRFVKKVSVLSYKNLIITFSEMLDVSNENFETDVSEILNPSMISHIISKYVSGENCPDEICLSFVKNKILPEVKKAIVSCDKASLEQLDNICRVFVQMFDQEGVEIVKSEVFPSLKQCFIANCIRNSEVVLEAFSRVLLVLPEDIREPFIIETISKFSVDSEYRIRMLSANLVPNLKDSNSAMKPFRPLSMDRVSHVRTAAVKVLSKCNFDERLVLFILTSACKDTSVDVRQAAAETIGIIAPQLSELFNSLLSNSETSRFALKSVKSYVSKMGLSPFFESLLYALKNNSLDRGAAVVLNISKLVQESEHGMLIECSRIVLESKVFLPHIQKFISIFSNSTLVTHFLNPNGFKNWRTRYTLLKLSEQLADRCTDSFIDLADTFSSDPVATVRNESAVLWARMIEADNTIASSAIRLLEKSFQQRLVLCRIIGLIGSDIELLANAVHILCNDPVQNVRTRIFLEKTYID